MRGEGIVVWDSDSDDEDQQSYAIVTPAAEPWEIHCAAAVLVGKYNEGFLREGARVGVEYERADAGSFRYVARSAWLLPYDPALLERVMRDVAPPPVSCSRDDVVALADRVWPYYAHDPAYFVEYVVEQIQQDMHDLFIDTQWPACPRHPHHPMWYHDDYWWCSTDGAAIVQLGELSRVGEA